MENIHMIDIEKRKQQFKKRLENASNSDFAYIHSEFKKLIDLEDSINTCFSNNTKDKLLLGENLKQIRQFKYFNLAGFNSFEEYCDKEIGISKGQASKLISVFEFSKSFGTETFSWEQFTISQLQEMLYLSKDQLNQVDPTMTLMQIRALKNAPQTIDELKQNIKTDKEALLKVKNFDYDNDNYDFNYFTKFSRPDLAIIAFELYSRLKASRNKKTKKEIKEGIINIASVQKQVNHD